MVDNKIDILTVKPPFRDPFEVIQGRNISRWTDIEFRHITSTGDATGSYSHGALLDRMTKNSSADVIVIFDADAFPIAPWTFLLTKLDTHKAIAIRHSRFGYAHPSFFAAKKESIKSLSWKRNGDLDVGRDLSNKLQEQGDIYFLDPTSFFAENPDPLDPPIGAVYGGCIFHNWYTSRIYKTPNPDGIPNSIIEASIEKALREYG